MQSAIVEKCRVYGRKLRFVLILVLSPFLLAPSDPGVSEADSFVLRRVGGGQLENRCRALELGRDVVAAPEVLRNAGIFRIEAPTLERGDAFIMNHGRMQRVPIVRGFIRSIREAKVGLGSPRSLCKGRIR